MPKGSSEGDSEVLTRIPFGKANGRVRIGPDCRVLQDNVKNWRPLEEIAPPNAFWAPKVRLGEEARMGIGRYFSRDGQQMSRFQE